MKGAHLHVHSAFSFLDGASLPEQLVEAAAEAGIATVALTDSHRVSGLLRLVKAARAAGIKAVAGASVDLAGGGELVLLAPGPDQFAALTAVLTAAHAAGPRGRPVLSWEAAARWASPLIALTGGRRGVLVRALRRGGRAAMAAVLERLRQIWRSPDRLFIELAANRLPGDRRLFNWLRDLGEAQGVPLVATADVHYARRQDFALYDLLTCVRTGSRVEGWGPDRPLNAENYLKPWREMEEILREWPQALRSAEQLGERLQPPELLGKRRVPAYPLPPGETADGYLRKLAEAGARRRYGAAWRQVLPRLQRELAVIGELGYADYFLVVWDVARYAASRGIRYAGRGSAADSVVAYCLGITEVDAFRRQLLFERFMSRERAETPDIDIDFDARGRDAVEAYVRERYGAAHVARVATYQTYRQRLALREIGKVLGFPADELDRLARALPEASLDRIGERWAAIPEIRGMPNRERLQAVVRWAARAQGLPRHLGTHLGGVVISRDPLMAVTPVEPSAKGVPVVQFDKRDVEELGLLKLDLLSLRMFSAVEDAVATLRRRHPGFSYEALPLTDAATYRRLQRGEGIGVFQLESPAQRALALRLQPDRFEDLVASLALIRPGPIKGNMVDPYVARRRGREPVTYLHPRLEPILSKTYGVVLFQEQVIAIASELAGFTPGEADALRRVMTHGRSGREMERLGEIFQAKAVAQGVEPAVAAAVFRQIAGYASYGFNEAHAAAFAETAYRTAYLWEHHPTAYLVGLLNAEPLGYYPPDVLLVEGRRRGIVIDPVDVNQSRAETVQCGPRRIRLGLRLLRGWGQEAAQAVAAAGPYRHPVELLARVGLERDQVVTLIQAGGFDAIDPDRSALIAAVQQWTPLGLIPRVPAFPPWSRWQRVLADYHALGFGQHEQLLAPWRLKLRRQGFMTAQEVLAMPAGSRVRMVGTLIRPHRPPTRSGRVVVFFSLLDETGIVEASLSEAGYQRHGQWLFAPRGPAVAVAGRRTATGLAVSWVGPWPPLC